MGRAVVLLMDSFGIGSADDAERFGDVGSDTFGHIAEYCRDKRKTGALKLPYLEHVGLIAAATLSRGKPVAGFSGTTPVSGIYGYAQEKSRGKDTPSGHWEIAGVPVNFDWGYFPATVPCFPNKLIDELVKRADLPGVLGNCHASGTTIIDELGAEHIKTGKPIVYTSIDSVFQIAAHEKYFGLGRLYTLCKIARELVDEYNVGRVIARPFIGEIGQFKRTANRHDYSVLPPAPTLLDRLISESGTVIAVGKTADIFAHQGISQELKAENNMSLFDTTLAALKTAPDKSLIFTNFVDFDSSYGHRRDLEGYARALEEFDARLPELEKMLKQGDVVVITADHGCDPSWTGTDHTREYIPVLMFGPRVQTKNIGKRETFSDIGQTLAKHLTIKPLAQGTAF